MVNKKRHIFFVLFTSVDQQGKIHRKGGYGHGGKFITKDRRQKKTPETEPFTRTARGKRGMKEEEKSK